MIPEDWVKFRESIMSATFGELSHMNRLVTDEIRFKEDDEIKLKNLPIGDMFENEDCTRYKRISKTEFQIVNTPLNYLGKGHRTNDIILISDFKKVLEKGLSKLEEHLWFLD